MIEIRRAVHNDFPSIWSIFHPTIRQADTYPYPPDTDQQEAFEIWMAPPSRPYVALIDGETVGTYFIRPNQPGQGAHVANAGFMVSPGHRGRGIGRVMGRHALAEARREGFLAMQFNFVVSANKGAVALWQDLGFTIIGTLPDAFRHPSLGLVDVHIMHQTLGSASS